MGKLLVLEAVLLMIQVHYMGFCIGINMSDDLNIEEVTDLPPPDPLPKWVYAKNGSVPPGALVGGIEDGRISYVARLFTDDGVLPGKLVMGDIHAYASVRNGSKEGSYPDYQVLCNIKPKWRAASRGALPGYPFIGGRSFDGKNLYVCRSDHDGRLVPGYVRPKTKSCSISYLGQTYSYTIYEVLSEE